MPCWIKFGLKTVEQILPVDEMPLLLSTAKKAQHLMLVKLYMHTSIELKQKLTLLAIMIFNLISSLGIGDTSNS